MDQVAALLTAFHDLPPMPTILLGDLNEWRRRGRSALRGLEPTFGVAPPILSFPRRRALWVSKSDKLLEDAQRDWSALGQERLLVTPLSRFRQGTPIRLEEGILFTTYATIRSQEREGKASRVQQIVDWLGRDFDGVIVFDEAHAMANAAGGKTARGDQAASQQGKAGLRLQHALPGARVLYVSATGATTVENLAYAQRLGLWGGVDFPFATRAEFVAAIEDGGVAAMEVLARDLKALGLYAARSLSYEGVEYQLVQHKLTPDQIRIYDAYARAFQIIHNNLKAAMKASNIRSERGALNGQAMSAALSAFEFEQAALLQSSHHRDEDADPARGRSSATLEPAMRSSSRSSRPAKRCSSAVSPKFRPRNGPTSKSTSPRANTSSTTSSTPFRPSSSSPIPTAKGTRARGRFSPTASRSNAARRSNGATA